MIRPPSSDTDQCLVFGINHPGFLRVLGDLCMSTPSTPPEPTFLDTSATNGAAFFYQIKVE